MPVEAALLDSLSVFAEVGLCAVAVGAIAWVSVEQTLKWRSVRRLRTAPSTLAKLEDELRQSAEEPAEGTRPRQPSERLTLERLIRAEPSEAIPPTDPMFPITRALAEERQHLWDQAAQLSQVRGDIGASAAAGVAYVLARDPVLKARVGSVSQVAGFLQECDRVEREIGAASRRSHGR
jgi:hypothetical protein